MDWQIRRLNMDSSWHWAMGEKSLVVDPWLIGSEIDGFRWLNEQWHVTPPVPPEEVSPHDGLLISQSYSDHCHLPTLEVLPQDKPVLCTPKAYKLLGKQYPNRELIRIPDLVKSGWLEWNGLQFTSLHPGRLLDPVYFGVLVRAGGDTLAYFAHGFKLKESQLEAMQDLNVRLLITSFVDFKIPAILGGHVNPGPDNAYALTNQLNPAHIINTHDEEKIAKGLVSRTATIKYPDYDQVGKDLHGRFVPTPDYQTVQID